MVEVYTGKGTIHVTIYSDLGFQKFPRHCSLSLSLSFRLFVLRLFQYSIFFYCIIYPSELLLLLGLK